MQIVGNKEKRFIVLSVMMLMASVLCQAQEIN